MTSNTSVAGSKQARLPLVIYVLALGTFLMGTTEFVVAGLLPEIAADFSITVADAGLAITTFAVGMIVGAPVMALATIRLPRRVTLAATLALFSIGHVVAVSVSSFELMLVARVFTAVATGAFWSVGAATAAQTVGPRSSSRALGLVLGGGMLANVLGVPLGSFVGQLIGWRGTFLGVASLAGIATIAVARLVPADAGGGRLPSLRTELRVLGNPRLWLVLATCGSINAGVLSVYSFIAPLVTDRAHLDGSVIPFALIVFGVGALVGNVVGGRLGDVRPFRTPFMTAAGTLLACLGIWAFSEQAVALLGFFALLGLVGLSANPIMISLALRFGAEAPTLAAAMPTSIFNLGTALGTGATSALLSTGLGALAPAVVGVAFSVLTFVPLCALVVVTRRGDSTPK